MGYAILSHDVGCFPCELTFAYFFILLTFNVSFGVFNNYYFIIAKLVLL
jgi:hypothetical protein